MNKLIYVLVIIIFSSCSNKFLGGKGGKGGTEYQKGADGQDGKNGGIYIKKP